jgi:hypothetical protein
LIVSGESYMNEVQNITAEKAPDPQMSAIYRNLIENIRVTDDISFKLLGTVPLVSGIGSGGLSLLTMSGHRLNDFAVLGLSLIGCAITIGLFRWELRNIQRCTWFISRAANIERQMFPDGDACQFNGFLAEKHLKVKDLAEIKIALMWTGPWGKTRAEKLIYTAATAAWLIPALISVASLARHLLGR